MPHIVAILGEVKNDNDSAEKKVGTASNTFQNCKYLDPNNYKERVFTVYTKEEVDAIIAGLKVTRTV